MHLLFERSWDEIATGMFDHFKEYMYIIMEIIKEFIWFLYLKIRDVCMDFEPYFKVHSLVSVHTKRIILGQVINLNMIFHVVVSVYQFVKIWNLTQFSAEFLWLNADSETSPGETHLKTDPANRPYTLVMILADAGRGGGGGGCN